MFGKIKLLFRRIRGRHGEQTPLLLADMSHGDLDLTVARPVAGLGGARPRRRDLDTRPRAVFSNRYKYHAHL